MAQSSVVNSGKKFIQIDVTSDIACPWCFVGKTNLERAINQAKDQFDFEVRWHAFMLEPTAPKEAVPKPEVYKKKFAGQYESLMARVAQVFRDLGFDFDTNGPTANTFDCHRLITFAGNQGYDKQTALAGELLHNYHVEGKYVGDREVLLAAATKAGIEGAEELLDDPNKGLKEVKKDLEKSSASINGVPSFVFNGKQKLSGGQPPEAFLRAFQAAAK